jgi:hypothetical protein
MTQDEIIRMAREAGDDWDSTLPTDKEFLKRFADIVAEGAAFAEREACAKVCDDLYYAWTLEEDEDEIEPPDAIDCKLAIQARGQA